MLFLAVFESHTGYPTSNITFNADYDTFDKSGLLETKRAIIYNYLVSIGFPMNSDIKLTKGSNLFYFVVDRFRRIRVFVGSIVASFVSGSDATSLASAVNTISNNPNALSDLSVKSIYINGKTYSVSGKSDSTDQSSDTTGMIVSIVVGLVGNATVILVAYFAIQYYETHHARQRLINENVEMKINSNQVQPLNNHDDERMPSSTVSISTLKFQSTKN